MKALVEQASAPTAAVVYTFLIVVPIGETQSQRYCVLAAGEALLERLVQHAVVENFRENGGTNLRCHVSERVFRRLFPSDQLSH